MINHSAKTTCTSWNQTTATLRLSALIRAACVRVWSRLSNLMQEWLWRTGPPVPPASRGSCASRQTPQRHSEIRKFLKESSSPQTITRCMQSFAITSLFLAIAASQALVETVSLCILKHYFPPLSRSVYKSRISKDQFLQSGVGLFCFLQPMHPAVCFVTLKVPRSLKTLLIHTNDWPLFDVIENACTSCWDERRGAKMGKQMWQINWVEMDLPLRGEGKQSAYWVAGLL